MNVTSAFDGESYGGSNALIWNSLRSHGHHTDNTSRTPLHHMMASPANRSSSVSSIYYLYLQTDQNFMPNLISYEMGPPKLPHIIEIENRFRFGSLHSNSSGETCYPLGFCVWVFTRSGVFSRHFAYSGRRDR